MQPGGELPRTYPEVGPRRIRHPEKLGRGSKAACQAHSPGTFLWNVWMGEGTGGPIPRPLPQGPLTGEAARKFNPRGAAAGISSFLEQASSQDKRGGRFNERVPFSIFMSVFCQYKCFILYKGFDR